MKNITAGLGVVVVVLLLVGAFVVGESRTEIVECNTWAAQAKEFKNFYLTHWQADQCAAHNIVVNAPVQ